MPKKTHLTVTARTVGMAKRNPWKFITGAVVFLAGLPGAWAGANFLEPALPAHRGYVRDQTEEVKKEIKTTEDTTVGILRDLQIETAEGKRDNAANAIAKFQLDLDSEKAPQRKLEIGETLRGLQNTKDKLDAQIKTLNRLRGQ